MNLVVRLRKMPVDLFLVVKVLVVRMVKLVSCQWLALLVFLCCDIGNWRYVCVVV